MSSPRTFPTLDVVSTVTGTLMCDVGALYEVCGHVLDDDSLMSHQLPNASRAIEESVYAQHPWMRDLRPPTGDLPALRAWADDLLAERGQTVTLERGTAADQWVARNGLVDLADIAAGRPVLVIGSDEA